MENELIFQTPQVGNQFLRDTSFSPLNLTYSYGLQPRIGKNFEFLDGGGVGALGVRENCPQKNNYSRIKLNSLRVIFFIEICLRFHIKIRQLFLKKMSKFKLIASYDFH